MSKIFFVNSERRNWPKRIQDSLRQGVNPPEVTRRYLLMVEDPKIAENLKNGFSLPPHQCYPHPSGNEMMFYCVVSKKVKRSPRFVREIYFRLYKAGILKDEIEKIEILEGKRSALSN